MVEIPATDPQITYRGSWISVTSLCNASSRSRMATGPSSSFSFNFQGDAVYLSLSSYNALYNVMVRGQTTTFGASDSRVIPSNCSLSFGQAALQGQSNAIEVIVSGSSLDSAGQWSFAMEKIVVASTSPPPAPSNKSPSAIIKWVTATIGAAVVLILLMV
ncbi:hypothetical protein PTI98_005331 [Pleurotus ostreatus]|nr:hypothetical protein PTI98_005331 [Pleurotus ostreatus]